MRKILIVKGITNCTKCPRFLMENDGKATEAVCLEKNDYLNRGYEDSVPSDCPLPDEENVSRETIEKTEDESNTKYIPFGALTFDKPETD
jgi:hypothetical protein